MESLSRQPDLDRLLYQSTVTGSSPSTKSTALDSAGHAAQATAATVLSPEKADAGDRAEVQIKLVDKLQPVTSPAEAAEIGGGAAGENLDATTSSQLAEEAGAALDLAQRRALLLGRTKQRHVCLQCGRECPSKHKLKRHLSTHSEQRPYNCPLCGKSFKWTEYLAKHMRTQHPGVEVPVFSHGTSSSPSHDCISPPTSTSTSSTLTHSQLTPVGKHKVATSDDTGAAGSELKEGISLGSDTLGTGSIDESPITVYENSNLSSTITTSSHTAILTKPTLSEALPLTNELLQQQQSQMQNQQSTQQSPQSQQMMQPLLQQEILQLQQQRKQQEQKEQQQQLLQQQIQQHQREQQLQQQMQNQQAAVAQVPQQVLQQKQQSLQMPQVVLQQQQSQRQQLQLTQSTQDLLQATDLQTPHSLQNHMQTNAEQTYTTASGSSSSVAQVQQVDIDVTTQMGGGGGSSLLHPLAHVMNSEASVQSMGFVGQAGEAYDQTSSASVVYNTTDGYQDSSSSQVFASPVYNTQSVTQVYQIPPQSQSAQLSSENFTAQSETFSTATNTANYITSLTGLSPSQQEVSGQRQGMETGVYASQQRLPGGGSDLGSMEQMSMQSQQNPEPNVLHMQAQITQSAYELQSVQIQPTVMSSSIQTYDGTGMMQPSANFQDNSAGTYQDGTNGYQEGTNTYQTGTNTFAMQDGSGYQDGTSYQDHSQAATQSQTISSLATSFTDTDGLSVETARHMYSTSLPTQDHQQMSFVSTATAASGVGPYNSQMSAASETHLQQTANMYGSLTADTFQQTPTPGISSSNSGGGLTLQSQPQMTNMMLAEQHQTEGLHNMSQVEAVVTQQQTGDNPPTLTNPTTSHTTSLGHGMSEKASKKSQKPKVSVGTQCEVGPETFRALKEEEAQAKLASNTPASGSSHESVVLDATPISMLQTPVSSSLLLSSSESPSVQDALSASSTPSGNTSATDIAPTSQSDKVIRKYPCELTTCSKAYVHRKDLIRHMTLRHGMSPQKLEPVVIETPEKPYTCQVGTCRKSYFHQKDLRRHQRQCHSVNDNSNVQGAVEMTDADGKVMVRFPCDFPGCQRSYVHKKDLVRHKRVYHKDESKKPSIPVPVKFTEAELKRIRHEEKVFQDKETPNSKKPRLDSTGSIMSSGEDQSQFSEMAAIQISDAVDMTQLSTTSPTASMDQHSTQNQVSYDSLSSTVQEMSEEEASQLTNAELTLNMSQQQQGDHAIQRHGGQLASQPGGVNLPTILRRQRPGSNGQLTTLTTQEQQEQQQQQLTSELALRNLASLMLGGLQGNSGGSGSGNQFDITQQAMAAFSSLPVTSSETASESTADAQQAAVAQFDPAAIISALSNVVNNPDILQAATPPTLDQQQVVSMENVTNALQYLTSTSNSTQ